MDKLVKEGFLSKTGNDKYNKNKPKVLFVLLSVSSYPFPYLLVLAHTCFCDETQQQKSDYEFNMVKEEMDGQPVSFGDTAPQVDDRMYMKVSFLLSLVRLD